MKFKKITGGFLALTMLSASLNVGLVQAEEIAEVQEYAADEVVTSAAVDVETNSTDKGEDEIVSLAASSTDVAYAVDGGYIYFNADTGAITDCDTSVTSADIPNEIDGISVTRISVDAFRNCSNLTNINIPDNVTYIGQFAFYGCSSLLSIEIPSGVTIIGLYVFDKCSSLESIVIPSGITSIGDYAFYNCSSLSSINIPSGVESIGKYAFYGCSSLTYIELPDILNSIEACTFKGCSSLENIKMPSNLTSISYDVFEGCSSLKSISIPSGVTAIESETFKDCSSLTAIELPSSLTSIDDYAFYGCSNITNITIPSEVETIGGHAFSYCSSLTSISIPSKITTIYSDTFYGCSSLTTVELPSGLTSINSGAFMDCSSLTNINIPESLTSIGYTAFSGCSSLTDMTIPSGVTNIEHNTFYNCSNLTNVEIYGDIISIDERAFYNCSCLTDINLPDSITSIGYSAFYNCSSLSSINIPSGVTIIEEDTFYGCSGLTSVELPNSLTSIGYHAFEYCSGLTDVVIPDSVTSISPLAFAYCSSLTNISVPSSVTSISSYTFYGCRSLTTVELPSGLTSIGLDAFSYCSSLTSINIPSSVTNIDSWAFAYCRKLTNITIPSSVTSISSYTFYGCSNLTDISIPKNVTSIKEKAFGYCTSLTSIEVPSSVESIDDTAFDYCDKDLLVFYVEEGSYADTWAKENGWTVSYEEQPIIYIFSLSSGSIDLNRTLVGYDLRFYVNRETENSDEISVTSSNINVAEISDVTIANELGVGSKTYFWVVLDMYNSGTTVITATDTITGVSASYELTVTGDKEIVVAKLDEDDGSYTTDFNEIYIGDKCSFSYEITVDKDDEISFDISDWSCSDSDAVVFSNLSVVGPSLSDSGNNKTYYISVLGEIEKTGTFTVTFTSPNGKSVSKTIVTRHFKLTKDSWNWNHWDFLNNAANYEKPYYMSEDVFYRVLDRGVGNAIHYSGMKTIIDSNGEAGGMCSGLAVSAAMIYAGLPEISEWYSQVNYAYDVSLNDIHIMSDSLGLELHEFIEAVHASQYMEEIARQDKEHKNKYQDLINAVSEFEESGNNPVTIGVTSILNTSGHVLLGYKVEEVDNEIRVYVYDCNKPNNSNCYITFTCDASGNPTDWSYEIESGKIWGSNGVTGIGAYICYEDDFTPIYNKLLSTAPTQVSAVSDEESSSSNFVVSTSDYFTVSANDGNIVTCSSGVFSGEEDTDVIPVIKKNYIEGYEYSFENAMFYYDGTDMLAFENDSDKESVSTIITNNNSAMTVTSDGQSKMELGEDDSLFNASVTPSASNAVSISYVTDDGNSIIDISGETDSTVTANAEDSILELEVSGFKPQTVVITVTQDEETSTIENDTASDSFSVSLDEDGNIEISYDKTEMESSTEMSSETTTEATETSTTTSTETSTETTTKATETASTEATTETTTTTSSSSSSSSGGSGGGGSSSIYIIKLVPNNGVNASTTYVKKNGILAEPDTPVYDGYTFTGWYTDSDCTTLYDFSTKVTSSFTLYGGWKEADENEAEDEEIETEEEETQTETEESVIEKIVKVVIGSAVVTVETDGQESTYTMDTAPYIQSESSSTLVPLRFVAVAVYGDEVDNADSSNIVAWDSTTKTALINVGNDIISFTAGSEYMNVNGKDVLMSNGVKAEITDGRMFIPFRALGEALGVDVDWEADTKTAVYSLY